MSTMIFGSNDLASFAKYLTLCGVEKSEAIETIAGAAIVNCAAYNIAYREAETPISAGVIAAVFDSVEAAENCGALIYNCDGLLSADQVQALERQPAGQVLTDVKPDAGRIVTTIREAFNFSVDKFPLTGPDNMPTPHYGLFRHGPGMDRPECVGNACSAKYEPHTVDDLEALAVAGSAAFDGDCEIDCNWRDGHYLTISPSPEYRRSIFGTKDNIFPRLIISAGYDGKAFRGTLGLFRDLCDNLQMLKSVESVSASIRHTVGLRDNIDDLTEQFSTVAARWAGVVETVQAMEDKQVDLADFLAAVYPESEADTKQKKNSSKKRIQKIFTRVLREREQSGRERLTGSNWKVSAWEAFNGVQGYAQHDKTRRGNPSDFEKAVLAFDDKAVMQAERLALSM